MKFHLRLPFSILLILSTAIAAQTDTATLESRLAKLEQQLARIEARLGETGGAGDLAPTIKEFNTLTRQLGGDGKSPPTLVQAGGSEPKLTISGFVHTHAEFGGTPDSRYNGINNRILLRRARITTKATFAENFELTVQPDFGNNSIAGNTAYRGGFADAFVAWTKYEAANLQLGQFKSAFGYEQLVSDTKTPLVERALPSDMMTVGRQIGVALLGSVADKTITYNVGAYNSNGVNNGNNDNSQFMYAGRVGVTPWSKGTDKLSLATNGYWSNDTGAFTGWRTAWGLDSQLTLGRWDLNVEYLHSLQNRLNGTGIQSDGWSLLGAYYLIPKRLQALIRYETFDANTTLSGTTSATWIYGANYFLKGDDIKFSLDYYLGNPAGPLKQQGRFMSRMQVVF